MGDALMDVPSDRGSTPRSSILKTRISRVLRKQSSSMNESSWISKFFKKMKKTLDFLETIGYTKIVRWLVGQAVKTPPSHGGNRGSIPLRATILIC